MPSFILFPPSRLERHQECFPNHVKIPLPATDAFHFSSNFSTRMPFQHIRLIERDENISLPFDAARSIVKLFHALLNAERLQLFQVVILEDAIGDSNSALPGLRDIA